MAKKKTAKANTKPLKRKPAKRKSKAKGKRKVNRYIAIRSATSKYCKENYGKACPEKEMNRIYWELKARYGDVPLKSVLDEMDVILGNKDRDSLPDDLILFSWFHIEYLLFRADGLFFSADDDITLDLSNMGMGVFEGKYGEMPLIYRDEIYPTLRGRTYEAESNGWSASPLPTFNYNSKASSVKNRKFVWGMEQTYLDQKELDGYAWQDNGQRSSPMKTIPQAGVSSDAVRLAELQKDINAQREDAFNRVDRMLDMGVITKEQYKGYYDDIMSKYAKGGIV